MRLPPGSRALRRRSSLPYSVAWRAPHDGTVGLRNPVTRDPVWERGDKVFGERQHATTGSFFNTDSDDFFPDVDVLFDNMSTSANAPYVILLCLFKIMLQTLPLPICVQLLIAYFLLECMTSLLPIILAMFYLLFSWIKSCGKLLIYSTIQKPYFRQFSPVGFAASMRPAAFDGGEL